MNLDFAVSSRFARRRCLASIILPIALTMGLMSEANACSCVRKVTPATFVQHAAIIFEGVPVKVELALGKASDPWRAVQTATVRSTFLVRNIYKGDLPETVIVESKMAASLCWLAAGGRRTKTVDCSELFFRPLFYEQLRHGPDFQPLGR